MAERKGTGGRGGMGTLEDVDLSTFQIVDEAEEMDRSRLGPSKYQPLIDFAKQNPNRKIEDRVPVQAADSETGELLTDQDGNPVWSGETEPRTYSKDEAAKFESELRNAGTRNKLGPRWNLSLRIIVKPSLKSDSTDPRRVQFYVIPLNRGNQSPNGQPEQS